MRPQALKKKGGKTSCKCTVFDYLPPDVARGVYFHGRGIFYAYFHLMIQNFYGTCTWLLAVGKIKNHLAGFPPRLENLENENGHGKVMEHVQLAKSHGIFRFSHGILPILPPICTKFAFFLSPLRN